MRILIGIILMAIGVIAILFGDKKLNAREGFITKVFSPPHSRMQGKLLKYAGGCAFIYIGLRNIFDPWF